MALHLLLVLIHSVLCCSHTQQTDTHGPDSFRCVDVYKQPGLIHTRLKMHKLQRVPSFLSPRKEHSESCPEGMVPLHSNPSLHPINDIKNGQHFAIIRSKSMETYHGAAAKINLQNPAAEYGEYSKANIWVQKGSESNLNSIEVGWAVNPILYGDRYTRLTTYWTVDNFNATGCYNALCSGYLQIHRSIFLGKAFIINPGTFQVADLAIIQDQITGNWWLISDEDRPVGYWAKELFDELGMAAAEVLFGGAIKSSPDGDHLPPMGNGVFPLPIEFKACYFTNVKYAFLDYNLTDVEPLDMDKFVDLPTCYALNYYFRKVSPSVGQTFTFGGPGGLSRVCPPRSS